jgi:hypothetical protein
VHLYEQEAKIRIVSVSLCDDISAVLVISSDGLLHMPCLNTGSRDRQTNLHNVYQVDKKQNDVSQVKKIILTAFATVSQ